jgi:hypothetical protein
MTEEVPGSTMLVIPTQKGSYSQAQGTNGCDQARPGPLSQTVFTGDKMMDVVLEGI